MPLTLSGVIYLEFVNFDMEIFNSKFNDKLPLGKCVFVRERKAC